MKAKILTLVLLMGLGSLGFSTSALAANDDNTAAATAMRSLNKLSILMNKATMAYQMFKLDQGNPQYGEDLDSAMQRIHELYKDYQQPVVDAGKSEQLNKLNQLVNTFTKKITFNQKKIASGGFESYAVSSDMYQAMSKAQKIAEKLYDAVQKSADVKVEEPVQKSRDIATLLQLMASSYIEQSVSVSGNALRGSGNMALDKAAEKLSNKLDNFDIHSDKIITINVKVRDVKNKWIFLKSSFVHYKERVVPFLVYRYADHMVDDLLAIDELYENRNKQKIKPPTIGGATLANGVPLPTGIPAAKDAKTKQGK